MLEQDSALELELGLLGDVPSYDQLLVDCTLSLGGLLRINLTDDYMPSTGDFADFLVADSLALAFAGLELIASGQQISWTAGGVDLPDARQAWGFEILSAQAVDEPSVPVLVGSASLRFCRVLQAAFDAGGGQVLLAAPGGASQSESTAQRYAWHGGDKLSLRYIIVPKEIHDQYVHAPSIPLFQMTAKNVGIRRAEGEFILCTNIDLLFSDELFEWLANNKLKKGAYYRAPRADVTRDINEAWPLQQHLDWCKKNMLVKWGYNSSYLNLVGFPNWVFRIPDLPEVLNSIAGPLRQWKDPLNYQISKLDYNACGDFTLMSKEDWGKIEGYVELDLYSIHIDSTSQTPVLAGTGTACAPASGAYHQTAVENSPHRSRDAIG